ncbi:hypothetical protein [Arthrobacter russicus]|uniref:Tetratricopeptide repeat protein n=1 Tax=Arthrobacter russicus TaxID=172040 RepID=A0ABU1JDC0_9MICC|nr:hypothetical protein [Arthrobacter russicus]MDR6270424.1 hypothetical protein [Arthrobacter russicus]
MSSRQEAQDLLDQSAALPYGPEEIALVQSAVSAADAAGAEDLAYLSRLHLIASASMVGDTEAGLTAFTWCLGKHDADPAQFPYRVDGYDLLWYFKHMAGHLSANPAFSLAQLDQMLQEMEARYQAAGVGLSGVWQAKFSAATTTGQLAQAAEFRNQREAIPRDDYSHCEACVRSEDVEFFAATGRAPEALARYDEIIEQNLSCADEPEFCESNSLLRLLRAGRLDDAKTAHLRAYRMAMRGPDSFPMLWHHQVFCAVTGNEARGLSILERSIHLLPEDPLDLGRRFNALLGYGALLDAVAAAGHAELPVRAADAKSLQPILGGQDGGFTVSGLAAASWAAAEKLAEAFDQRNGNLHYAGQVAAMRAAGTEHYPVPLDGQTFVAASLPEVTEPTTAEEWLERAYIASGLLDDPEAAISAAEAAIGLAETDRIRASAATLLISNLVNLDRDVAAVYAVARRGEFLRAEGRDYLADVEQRLGLLLFGRAGLEQDESLLLAEFEAAKQQGDADAIVALGCRLAIMWWGVVRVEEAISVSKIILAAVPAMTHEVHRPEILAMFGSLYSVASDTDLLAQAAELLDNALASGQLPTPYAAAALRARARLHGRQGEFQAGTALADQRADLCLKAGARNSVIDSLMLAAALYSDAGQDDVAAQRAQQAARHAALAESEPGQRAAIDFKLAQYQLWNGQSEFAMETFDGVREREEAAGEDPGSIAMTLLWHGRAANAAGLGGEAYRSWSTAMQLAGSVGNSDVLAMAGIDLAQLLIGARDEEVLEVAQIAVAAARESGVPQLVVQALDISARAKSRFGDPAGLAEFDEAIGLAGAQEAEWNVADLHDSKGRGLLSLRRITEGVAELLSAADAFAALGDGQAAAMSELAVGRVLAEESRLADSFTAFRAALERLPEGSPAHSGISVEFADLLESAGRREEAEAVRAGVRL